MTTALDLIAGAMDDAGITGIGQTPLAEDTNKALRGLNAMIAQWMRRRWMVYHLEDVTFQATGALSYSIGAGGDIAATRPDRIEAAFFRQTVGAVPNQVDYPLWILDAREEYNRIALKSMPSFPQYLFYDSAFPLGNLFIWPVASNLYEVHLSVKSTLQQFATLKDAFNMPAEYEECIRLNLAVRLRVAYQLPMDQQLTGLAKVALNTIKNTNTQIPSLQLPPDLVAGGSRYNIYGDESV